MAEVSSCVDCKHCRNNFDENYKTIGLECEYGNYQKIKKTEVGENMTSYDAVPRRGQCDQFEEKN